VKQQTIHAEELSLIFLSRRLRLALVFFSTSNVFAMTRFAVLFVVCFASFANTRSDELLVPYAIKAIIDEYFAKNVHEIEVINFGVRNGRGDETIGRLLRLGNQRMPMKVIRDVGEQFESDEYKLNTSSIVLFDSPENFNRTQHRIVFQHGYLISHPHLVHIHNAEIEDIQVVAHKNYTIDKMIFLVHETLHSIQLATSYMFTPEACHENQFKVINRFTRGQKRWENSNFFVEKYRNFYKCQVDFPEPTIGLSRELNYSHTSNPIDSRTLLNETITYYIQFLGNEMFQVSSYVFHIESRKIVIPPGELYGDYEKMFFPFDNATWVAIGVTIFLAIFTILVVKLRPLKIQEIVFGRNNRSPLMNFISILINGSQHRTMVENGPRICLAIFLFWSLIFR
jgi:hypothetical protein